MWVPIVNFFVWLFLVFWPSTEASFAGVTANLKQGDRVMHYRLGMGTIVATVGPSAEVKFDGKTSIRRVSMKQLQIR